MILGLSSRKHCTRIVEEDFLYGEDGQPLLRLLELYVLWAIGELSQELEDGLKKMAPNCNLSMAAMDNGMTP